MIDPEPLDGKVALVTGAARRIGAQIATTLHGAGACVAIHFKNSSDEAEALSARLNALRANSATIVQADLANTVEIENLVDTCRQWLGRLDIVVNNASSFYPTPLGTISEAAWLDLIGSNLKAPLYLANAAKSHLQETAGTIVNIVDIHAKRPLRDHHIYGAAKAGLAMLTKSLAKDLAPGVRVNGVAPGAIIWPEDGMPDTTKQEILEQIPLGVAGHPADIANAVLFLARDATFVTGQILPIDGGRSIGW